MKFSNYLKFAVWDFLLVLFCSISLGYVSLNGFYIDPSLQSGPVPAVATIVMVAILFLVGYRRKYVLPGAIVYAVLVIVGCIAGAAMSWGSLTDDTEGNYLIFAISLVVTGTVPYLISRKRAGTVALLIIGIFVCGWIQFFYGTDEVLWSLVFLFCALALVIYKNYQLSARSATTVRKVSFAAGFGVAAATVAVAVGIGALIWVAVVAPLNPGVLNIKLITEHRALETVQVHGTSAEYLTPNMDTTSDQTNKGIRTTDDLQRDDNGISEPARPLNSSTNTKDNTTGTFLGIDTDSIQDAFDFEANPQQASFLWLLLLLIPVLIIAYFVGRRLWRTRRLNRIKQLPPSQQVEALYLFLTKKLARLGFAIPSGSTPIEFAANNASSMERFDNEGGGLSFVQVTAIYSKVAYGHQEATEEEANGIASYYSGFWKAARAQLGNLKYFFKSFRL